MRQTVAGPAQAPRATEPASPEVEVELELAGVRHGFGELKVIDRLDLRVGRGETVAVVGPSGCGKTTLLRIVGGFTPATSGQVILDGEDIGHLPPNMRNTKMVFQSYALFPHMNVRKNIGFGLKLQKWPKEKIDDRVDDLLSLVQMEGLGDRTIDRISGGQQQRDPDRRGDQTRDSRPARRRGALFG